MSTVHVKVTREHIDRGVQCDPTGCPVAAAIVDAGLERASVGTTEVIEVVKGGEFFFAHLPKSAVNFVGWFDNWGRKGVEPFEFDLEVDDNA